MYIVIPNYIIIPNNQYLKWDAVAALNCFVSKTMECVHESKQLY